MVVLKNDLSNEVVAAIRLFLEKKILCDELVSNYKEQINSIELIFFERTENAKYYFKDIHKQLPETFYQDFPGILATVKNETLIVEQLVKSLERNLNEQKTSN